jgi:hypothetical protein
MTIRPDEVRRNDQVFETRESELDVMQGDPLAWLALDSVYLADGGGAHRAARLCSRERADRTDAVSRTFKVVRRRTQPHIMDVERADRPAPATDMGACGRRYSLALLALLDALAAEPPRSPLATGSPLDDLRATAFLVAGAADTAPPNLSLIDRAVDRADRRLLELRLPLRATGYIAARDALRRLVPPPRLAGAGEAR